MHEDLRWLKGEWLAAQQQATKARRALQDATVAAIQSGRLSEAEATRQAGVSRTTARKWQGKDRWRA